MFAFPDIQHAVATGFQGLSEQIRSDHEVKQYENSGGLSTSNPWQTAGFYTYESRKNRLVMEALYLEAATTCVVRVFREGRLKVFYAKKVVGELDGLTPMIHEAASAFQSHLPRKPVKNDEPDMSAFGDIAQSMERLLLPVPPPVRLSEL